MSLTIERFCKNGNAGRIVHKRTADTLTHSSSLTKEELIKKTKKLIEKNPSLYFERIGSPWEIKKIKGKTKLNVQKWLEPMVKDNKPFGNRDALENYAKRLSEISQTKCGKCQKYKTINRFITGMGIDHPTENGFLWHPTLGVPYLPGSSYKGMVRAFVEIWEDPDKKPGEEDIIRIFGGDSKTVESQGSVIFMDAVPLEPVTISNAIITPHYKSYYGGNKKFPDERESPVPITYITVAPGNSFQFICLPSIPYLNDTSCDDEKDRLDQAREDCNTVMGWTEKALKYIGAGAKTKSGYGRFKLEKKKKK